MTRNKNTKILFWGTPEFTLPSLEALIENGYNITAVITNPDEPVGRKQLLTAPPGKVVAEKRGIPALQPVKLDTSFKLKISSLGPDLFVVAAYGKIIPKEILDIPKFGALNVHPSLLPRWRGPSPIQFTILNGDKESGVTIMRVDELMDHGPILAKRELANYELRITNYKDLHDKLAKLGAELLIETLQKYLRG